MADEKFLKINNDTESYYIQVHPSIEEAQSSGQLFDAIYPVGSIYWTDSVTFNPNDSFTGTWVRIEDKFIFAAKVDSSYRGGQ